MLNTLPEDQVHGRYVYRSRGTLDGLGGLRLQYQSLVILGRRGFLFRNLFRFVWESF